MNVVVKKTCPCVMCMHSAHAFEAHESEPYTMRNRLGDNVFWQLKWGNRKYATANGAQLTNCLASKFGCVRVCAHCVSTFSRIYKVSDVFQMDIILNMQHQVKLQPFKPL